MKYKPQESTRKTLKISDLTFCKSHMYLVIGSSDSFKFSVYLVDRCLQTDFSKNLNKKARGIYRKLIKSSQR